MSGHLPSDVPPQVVVSEPMSERASTGNYSGLKREAPAPLTDADERNKTSPVWVDVDEERPRRRRRSRRPTPESTNQDRSAKPRHSGSAQGDIGRFLPRLSRILEAADPNVRQRSYHGSDQKRDLDDKARSTRLRDENDHGHRHAAKRRTTVGSRRPEPLPTINPSLLSVLSSLTSASDRSSGSNSTITQQSYDRKRGLPPRRPPAKSKEPSSRTAESTSGNMPRKSPNVFDYMEDVTNDANAHDGMPVVSPVSSASSQYQPSDAGSSEVSTTPSSRSTLPSPTTTRSVSVAELRRKYDPDYAGPTTSHVDSSNVELSTRILRQQRSYKNFRERMVEEPVPSMSTVSTLSAVDFNDGHRQSSHGSLRALDDEQRLRQQEEEMRRHMAQSQHPCAYEYTPALEDDSPDADHDARSNHQSLDHYIHQPVPSRPAQARIVRSTPSPPPTSPPHAPDAPDLSRTTLAGYELLASRLAPPHFNADNGTSTPSHITPLYRTFSQLHHRVLLHLQDELAEKEAHLRLLDESIAQTCTAAPNPTADSSAQISSTPEQYPASRRGERNPNYHPIFARRTQLLGEIYLKQQQYHSALRDYASAVRDSRPAEQSEVAAYKSFLADRKPIWEGETGFLDRLEDLIVPGGVDGRAGAAKRSHGRARSGGGNALLEQASFVAALLLLPLLISTVLPDFASRAAATAFLGAGASLVVWGAKIRSRV